MHPLPQWFLLDRGCALCGMSRGLFQCSGRGVGMQFLPQWTIFLPRSIHLFPVLRVTARAVVVSVFVVGTINTIHLLRIVLCSVYRLFHAIQPNIL